MSEKNYYEKKSYYESQVKRLGVVDDLTSVKFVSGNDGETNLMSLNAHSIPVFIKLLQGRLEAFNPKEAESPKNDRATTVGMTIRELLRYNTQLPVYIGLHKHRQEFAVDDIFTIIENSANNRIIIETWQDFKLSDTQKEKLLDLLDNYKIMTCLDTGEYCALVETILANP